jgi:hypothetical protein
MFAVDLRVALFGPEPEASDWEAILGARGCRVVRVTDALDLFRTPSDMALAIGPPATTARIASSAAESPS